MQAIKPHLIMNEELRQRLLGAARWLGWAVIFGLACTQAPLYYSNQNQYFLHGLAQGGWGFLDQDWLANTRDPTPVFSALVAFTYRYLSEYLFYVYYIVLFGVYLHSLTGLVVRITAAKLDRTARWCFLTLFVVLHSGLMRLASVRIFGVDYPWYFQCGLAGQYILGAMLQPSVFGVLLLGSVHAFLGNRAYRAVLWSSLAGIIHSTYLLGAAFLTVSYMVVLFREGRRRDAVLVGAGALLLVLPVVVYNLIFFAPSSANTFAEAQHVLVEFRLPHHAVITQWFDGIAGLQVNWMLFAIYLVRRQRIFPILVITFLLALSLTLVQLATGSAALALLFPWRISAVLIPLATTIILGRLVGALAPWLGRRSTGQVRAITVTCAGTLGVLMIGGLAVVHFQLAYPTNHEEIAMMEFVRDHKQKGDVYLLPIKVPRLGSGPRGAASTSFTPPPQVEKGLIPVDLQRFRLFTGAAIFVDFKSIPYRDVEVLAWHERVLWNQKLFADGHWDKKEIKAELAPRRITHVVTAATSPIRSDALETVYEGAHYRVYRLGRPRQAILRAGGVME